MNDTDDYVAWCRYTDKSIVTCDSDDEGAFRVYRRGDKDTMLKFNQMADCLDDIRKILEDRSYSSRLNLMQAIRDKINFDIPETPRDLLDQLAAENAALRAKLERAVNLLQFFEDGDFYCDFCGADRNDHLPNCELAAILRDNATV